MVEPEPSVERVRLAMVSSESPGLQMVVLQLSKQFGTAMSSRLSILLISERLKVETLVASELR